MLLPGPGVDTERKKRTRVVALLQTGKLCDRCDKKCREDIAGLWCKCPECDGVGCEHCGQRGSFPIGCCPYEFIRPLGTAVTLAKAYSDGIMPDAGGLLDQTQSFMQFVRVLEAEKRVIREEDD